MVAKSTLKKLAQEHGTPLYVVDHAALRKNYAEFKRHLPRVQAYYAVKANPDPAIVRTLYEAGASFDVASMPEFLIVHEYIKHLPAKAAAGFHLGQDHLRQSDQGQRNPHRARSLQTAGDLRQFRGDREDPQVRPACRTGA